MANPMQPQWLSHKSLEILMNSRSCDVLCALLFSLLLLICYEHKWCACLHFLVLCTALCENDSIEHLIKISFVIALKDLPCSNIVCEWGCECVCIPPLYRRSSLYHLHGRALSLPNLDNCTMWYVVLCTMYTYAGAGFSPGLLSYTDQAWNDFHSSTNTCACQHAPFRLCMSSFNETRVPPI